MCMHICTYIHTQLLSLAICCNIYTHTVYIYLWKEPLQGTDCDFCLPYVYFFSSLPQALQSLFVWCKPVLTDSLTLPVRFGG